LPLLSVYRDLGVVEREGREDNFNKPGMDLATYRVVYPGDLVMNKMKTWQGSLGVSQYHGIVSPAYFVCELTDDIDRRYLHYLLRSRPYIAEFAARSKGIRPAQWDLPWDEFKSILVVAPPRSKQEGIADFLDRETARIDAVVGKKQSLLDELVKRRRSVLFHGVTGQLSASSDLHDPGLPWARGVRRTWPAARIKHVAQLGTGHTPSRSHPEYWENCTIPWITTGEIQQVRDDRAEVITDTREKISALGLANSAAALHPAGTVVLCRTASAGFSAIMGEDMATSQDFATWTCSDHLLPRYLLMCLRAMRRDLLGRLAFSSTHKTIYMPDIEALKIPLPTVEEQQEVLAEIDRRLANIDALTERLERQLALLAEHRQALIAAMVSGETDVPKQEAQERQAEGQPVVS
jgi:type I restriction enzyme S subunit